MLNDEDREALAILDTELEHKQEELRFKRELISFAESIRVPDRAKFVLTYIDPSDDYQNNGLLPGILRVFTEPGSDLRWAFLQTIVNRHVENCLEEIREAISERLKS